MTYLPHTDDERGEMLRAIGVADLTDLFGDVPERLRFPDLKLLPACSEPELAQEMRGLAARNREPDTPRYRSATSTK